MKDIELLNNDEQAFLASWEEVFKKGSITYMVLIYLSRDEMYIGSLYQKISLTDTIVNEHSLYRLIRKLYDVGLIDLVSAKGRYKYYRTSESGHRIVTAFTKRNITPLIEMKEL